MFKRYKQLTSEHRYVIYLGIRNGDTLKTIANLIGASPSTVSRGKEIPGELHSFLQ
nr:MULTISPECIES: helix-turn-helix domain-containing protein [unclassified Proteiniphilum]